MKKPQSIQIIDVLNSAQTNPIKQIETAISELHLSKHISPLDSCTCTGNCGTCTKNQSKRQ